MPRWVTEAYGDYAKRLQRDCTLSLREIAPAKRGKTSTAAQWREDEGQRLLAAVSPEAHVVALDVQGAHWSTAELGAMLERWLTSGRQVALLVGGADGLSSQCLARADQTWSLSRLTFPHGLVRVVVAEQIYRAWSVMHGHPYHRA